MGASRALVGPFRWLRQVRPGPAIGVAAVLATLAVAALATHALLEAPSPPAGRASPAALRLADANGVLDSDNDGVSDARENYIYGTNPLLASTSGGAIPDGWLVRYGFDPLDPGVEQQPAAVPPAEALPPAYRGVWPSADTPTLLEVYSQGRPDSWNVSAQGPYDSGLDPREWDNSGDGIPDGWLLRHGLDPLAKDLAGQRLAGPDGLTVRAAFEHRTDPRQLDTDGDGIPDVEEIAGPRNPDSEAGGRFAPTDPARYDTGGAGVCDGYLRAHRLDPSDPRSSYSDQDRDGATTAQEFAWSVSRFGNATCATGKGLDPHNMFSGGLAIPDGWLVRYNLDPLDPATPKVVTANAATEPGPPLLDPTLVPADLALTVADEYGWGRPANWSETRDGPWWGGTNPASNDTDGDGLGDAWEMRGYVVRVSSDPRQPQPALYVTRSDPTKADTDDDGLLDGVEADKARNGGFVMDAQRRDTDFDGILDGEEFDYIKDGLDPTRADSTAKLTSDGKSVQVAGDRLADGERLALLKSSTIRYGDSAAIYYGGPGQANATLATTAFAGMKGASAPSALPGPGALTATDLAARVEPRGRLYKDANLPANVANPDIDGDGLDNGVELHPELYATSPDHFNTTYAGHCIPRPDRPPCPPTDPLHYDSDGDLLQDGWEVEHSRSPDGSLGLHPAKWDTGSGRCKEGSASCSDADKDPDGDSITWYTYGPTGRSERRFTFENLKEQVAETDPTDPSTDGDGLGDGWKEFWGSSCADCYRSVTDRGLVFPKNKDTGGLDTLAVLSSPAFQHLRLGTVRERLPAPAASLLPADQPSTYHRTVLADASGNPEPDSLLPGEVALVIPNQSPFKVSTKGQEYWVVQVQGTVSFTLQDARELGTNPYMAADSQSSDGDWMPDWWEDLFGRSLPGIGDGPTGAGQCATVPDLDPSQPDGGPRDDADQDGLLNLLEYTHDTFPSVTGPADPEIEAHLAVRAFPLFWVGGNPLCRDADLGGISDGNEASLSDFRIGFAADDTRPTVSLDSDGDGISDFQEVTAAIPTDPFSPDTDGDGLLDGGNRGPYFRDSTPNGRMAQLWLGLGIVYQREDSGSVQRYLFLGEKGQEAGGTNPTDADQARAGVPQGWLVAHGLNPFQSYSQSCRPYYEMHQPSWWKGMERRKTNGEGGYGPWWGGITGAAPNTGSVNPCPSLGARPLSDDDKDGLLERDIGGEPFEDAMPGASHTNALPKLDGSVYGWPASAPLTGTIPLDPTDPNLNATVRRLAAQAHFDPHSVTSVGSERFRTLASPLGPPAGRTAPCITLDSGQFEAKPGNNGQQLSPKTLPKGVERILKGHVRHCGSGLPVAGVTVEARMGPAADRELFGAAFTDSNGAFALPVNISVDHTVATVPAGSVLRGQAVGPVSWKANPSKVTTGQPPESPRTLTLVTYANAGLEAAILTPPLEDLAVTASPRIDILQPTAGGVVAGQDLAVELHVADTGGTPLPGRLVHIRLGSATTPRTTDANGLATATLRIPLDSPLGATELTAESASGPDEMGPVSASKTLMVRSAPTLLLTDLPPTADAGGDLSVAGRATVRGQPVSQNVQVVVRILGASADARATSAIQGDGNFRATVPVPAGTPAGSYTMVASVEQGPTNLAGQGSGPIHVRGLVEWTDTLSDPLRVDAPAIVQARLVEAAGRAGVAGVPVRVTVGDLTTTATTSSTGAIHVIMEGTVPPHPVLQTLSFSGDAMHTPRSNQIQRDVSSPTTSLNIPDGVVPRGGDARVPLRLRDAGGQAIVGVPVAVTWGREPNRTVMTDDQGRATFVRAGSPDDPLGTVVVQAAYVGAADGTRGQSKATALWSVRALAEMVLPSGNLTAGNPVPPGLLRDAGTLRPIAGARVTVQVYAPGLPTAWSNTTTDGLGLFTVLPSPLADAAPQTLHVVTATGPLANYPAARAGADLVLRSATILDAQAPAVLVLGREVVMPVRVTDARHLPVPAGGLRAFIGAQEVGQGEVQDGLARVRLLSAEGLNAGSTTLRLAFAGTATHAPNETFLPVRLVAPATLTLQIHSARPGGTARVEVQATAAGAPLSFSRVNLEVQGQPGGLSAMTDKEGKAVFLIPQANATLLVAALLEGGPVLGPASASAVLAPLQPVSVLQRGLWVASWLAAAAAVLAAVAAWVAHRLRRRDPLASAFERTRSFLVGKGPLQEQVLRAYRSLEDAAIAQEILDAPANTPRLLEQAIASRIPAPLRTNLDLLVSLFEKARYGYAPIRPLEKEAAVAALDNLVRGLRAPPPAVGGTA